MRVQFLVSVLFFVGCGGSNQGQSQTFIDGGSKKCPKDFIAGYNAIVLTKSVDKIQAEDCESFYEKFGRASCEKKEEASQKPMTFPTKGFTARCEELMAEKSKIKSQENSLEERFVKDVPLSWISVTFGSKFGDADKEVKVVLKNGRKGNVYSLKDIDSLPADILQFGMSCEVYEIPGFDVVGKTLSPSKIEPKIDENGKQMTALLFGDPVGFLMSCTYGKRDGSTEYIRVRHFKDLFRDLAKVRISSPR